MLWFYFFTSGILSLLITPIVIFLMRRWQVIDHPKTQTRKIHKKKIPLGGGLAIYLAFIIVAGLALFLGDVGVDIRGKTLAGIAVGGILLMIGGIIDDKYNLPPRYQILFPVIASAVVIVSGIGVESISNPGGGVIQLNVWSISIEGLGRLLLLADFIIFFWLMGMMMTTKFLDGLDGLVSGVSFIGAIIIFFVTRQPQWYQPEVGIVALIFAAACLGFLVWNFHPAKIFLGESGSVFTGYMLGVLAIISGSKIATTLLVMGFPMLDLIRVIVVRIKKGKSPFVGDQEHLHYRLLNAGLGHKRVVLLMYSISILFGMSALFLQNEQKLIALGLIFVLMLLISLFFFKQDNKYDYR